MEIESAHQRKVQLARFWIN